MQGDGGLLLLGISTALYDRAANADKLDHELMQSAAANLEQIGARLVTVE